MDHKKKDKEQEELLNKLRSYIKEENKETFFKLLNEELDYRATDINENIKVLINEELEPKLEDELLEDLLAQLEEIKESLITYKKVRNLFY